MKDDERPNDDAPEESGVYELDLDEAEGSVENLTREALEAVERAGGRAAEPAGDTAAEAGDEPSVAAMQAEIEDLRDRSVRTLADFENFRRRAEREREDLKRFALAEALRDFLDVADNLERALAAGGSIDDLKTGVEMTLRQLNDVLRQRGVREVEAAGKPFDPNVHEAVARDEDEAVEAPTVVAELQKGYTLHGRLLRPAMVRVAVPPARGGTD